MFTLRNLNFFFGLFCLPVSRNMTVLMNMRIGFQESEVVFDSLLEFFIHFESSRIKKKLAQRKEIVF